MARISTFQICPDIWRQYRYTVGFSYVNSKEKLIMQREIDHAIYIVSLIRQSPVHLCANAPLREESFVLIAALESITVE